jgi:hypothetical protein
MAKVRDSIPSGRDQSTTPTEELPLSPPFALRSDGRILLGIQDHPGRDFGDREIWTGVVMRPDEEARIRKNAEHALDDIAARFVAQIPKKA